MYDSSLIIQSGVGAASWLNVFHDARASLQACIAAFVSGTVTYNIEATLDKAPSAGGNWFPLPTYYLSGASTPNGSQTNISGSMSGLTGNYADSLSVAIIAIRVNVTAGTGTVTLQLGQVRSSG